MKFYKNGVNSKIISNLFLTETIIGQNGYIFYKCYLIENSGGRMIIWTYSTEISIIVGLFRESRIFMHMLSKLIKYTYHINIS